MTEFAAKKLGEVLAFCRVGVETFERGRVGFEQIMDGTKIDEITSALQDQAKQLEAMAQEAGVDSITLPKAEGTTKKLQTMRDTYIGDEWDNPAELLEWSGFFEGSAIVHWALVEGAAKALENSELEELADEAGDFHEDLLERVEDELEKIGYNKAKA